MTTIDVLRALPNPFANINLPPRITRTPLRVRETYASREVQALDAARFADDGNPHTRD